MGQERQVRVTFTSPAGEVTGDGRALLETSEIVFRGPFRLRIPFSEVLGLTSEAGVLCVTWLEGTAVFELGTDAPKWADRVRNPRGLLDKLGVRPGMRVSVIGLEDHHFLAALGERGAHVSRSSTDGADLLFCAADSQQELLRLSEFRQSISDTGAIWVVSRKGQAATIKDTEVMAAARAAGLVDTKVVSFSDSHTALKLVVPAAQRKRPPRQARNA